VSERFSDEEHQRAVEKDGKVLETLRDWLDKLIAGLQHPQERRIGYGNVRHEYSSWGEGPEETTNIAIIYEIPGGSTCQLNISFSHGTGVFSYLDPDTGERHETEQVEEIQELIRREISQIPEKRAHSLMAQVDGWIGDGMSRSAVFAELNKLLQAEFLGGRINNKELQAAVQHVVRRAQGQAAAAQ